MKFKIGDKVRFVKSVLAFANVVDRGEIIKVDKFDKVVPYLVKLNNGRLVWCMQRKIVRDRQQQKIVITTDGVETVARLFDGKECVKTATAKCSTDDELDFEVGARIAFDRLVKKEERDFDFYIRLKRNVFSFTKKGDVLKAHKRGGGCFVYEKDLPCPNHHTENGYKWHFWHCDYDRISDEEAERELAGKDKFVPHLEIALAYYKRPSHYGNIGEETNYKDAIGRPLCIGDVVELFNKRNNSLGDTVIVKAYNNENVLKAFVMGIEASCDERNGSTCDWKIIKKRSYDEVDHGKVIHDVKFVKEP